jgi:pSer/pThr/pTyr-binding forkhead associated (FHA) protein
VAEVFCNRCGHGNPDGSNFCSSCGAPLANRDERTITFEPVENAEAAEEELSVSIEEVPEGAGMLVVKRGPNAGSKFVLTGAVTTAGRHPDSDIFLDDITVSRRHVELVHSGGTYTVRDVGSLNGTYLNRERIEEATLSNGDELQIGKYKLVFFASAAAGA